MIALAFYARHHQELNGLLDYGGNVEIIFPPTMPEKERTDIRKMAETVGGLAKKECTELLLECREDLIGYINTCKLPCTPESSKNRKWDRADLHLLNKQKTNKGRAMLGMTVTSYESQLVIACWVWMRGGRAVADALVQILDSPPAISGRDWHPDWTHGGTVVLGHHPISSDEAREVNSQRIREAVTSTFQVIDKEKMGKIFSLSR